MNKESKYKEYTILSVWYQSQGCFLYVQHAVKHMFILFLKIESAAYENDDIPFDGPTGKLLKMKGYMNKRRVRSHRMSLRRRWRCDVKDED
jgi:hypothetical protein